MAQRTQRRDPESSRSEILDAALACFSARGFHRTSIDDIAARARLSKGAVYWHFEGKRELFLALVDRFSESKLSSFEVVSAAPDWRAALRDLFALVRQELDESMPLFRLVLEYIAQSEPDEGIRERTERSYEAWNAAVRAQLARGVAEGALRPVAADEVGMVIGASIDGLMLAELMRPELDLDAALREAEEIFWRGLAK